MSNSTSPTFRTSQNLDPFETGLYDPFREPTNCYQRYGEQVRFGGCCHGYEGPLYENEWMGPPANENAPLWIGVTFFPNQSAQSKRVRSMTLPKLGDLILKTSAKSKDKLPWLKLATFGKERTDKNCLRHNANVLSISGIELDYDAKQMTLDEAIALAKKTKLQALLYTSASYNDAAPKWRILLPASKPLPPSERVKLVARVNGLYGGVFSPESFTLSQSYYYGSVNNNPAHRVEITEGDCIDLRDDLDAGAMGKSGKDAPPNEVNNEENIYQQYARELKRHVGEPKRPPLAKVAAALDAIPNDEEVDRAQWVKVGMAVKREYPVEGLELFLQWSESWAGWTPDQPWNEARRKYTIEKWESFAPHSITAGTLFHFATEASPGWWERAQQGAASDAKQEAKPLLWFYVPKDPSKIPPREWMHAKHYIRKHVVMTSAPGDWGKTSLILCNAIEMATGFGLIGPPPIGGPYRVAYWNAEDPDEEIDRRIAAICLHHKIDQQLLKDQLIIGGMLPTGSRFAWFEDGKVVFDSELISQTEEHIREFKIDCMIFDPLIAFHSVPENDIAMEKLIKQGFGQLAIRHDCCIELSQHMRKSGAGQYGGELSGDDSRGSSSIRDAVRSMRVLNRMSKDEAGVADIPDEERRAYLRIDRGKGNMLPPQKATWFQLHCVDLGNGDGYRPGDEVQVAGPWVYPQVIDVVAPEDIDWLQKEVSKGDYRLNAQAKDWVGYLLIRRLKLDPDEEQVIKRIKAVIKVLLKNGTLMTEPRKDKNSEWRDYVIAGQSN